MAAGERRRADASPTRFTHASNHMARRASSLARHSFWPACGAWSTAVVAPSSTRDVWVLGDRVLALGTRGTLPGEPSSELGARGSIARTSGLRARRVVLRARRSGLTNPAHGAFCPAIRAAGSAFGVPLPGVSSPDIGERGSALGHRGSELGARGSNAGAPDNEPGTPCRALWYPARQAACAATGYGGEAALAGVTCQAPYLSKDKTTTTK